ncbi:hypothetical protein LCGC14_1669360, partial [marine sediment metagenome]
PLDAAEGAPEGGGVATAALINAPVSETGDPCLHRAPSNP